MIAVREGCLCRHSFFHMRLQGQHHLKAIAAAAAACLRAAYPPPPHAPNCRGRGSVMPPFFRSKCEPKVCGWPLHRKNRGRAVEVFFCQFHPREASWNHNTKRLLDFQHNHPKTPRGQEQPHHSMIISDVYRHFFGPVYRYRYFLALGFGIFGMTSVSQEAQFRTAFW